MASVCVVVGSTNVDHVISVDRLPQPGETVAGGTFDVGMGGKGANQAVACGQAGSEVVFVTPLGEDDPGREALRSLGDAGVDVRPIVIPDLHTGVASVVVDAGGNNQITVASGANAAVTPEAIRERLASVADVSVVLVNNELPQACNLAAMRWAAEREAAIVLNPAPARALSPAEAALRPVLTPNAGEARSLTGLDEPREAALGLATTTGAPVVVTLGERGALVASGGAVTSHPAPAVDVVDTTGAGDAFNGSLAAALARGATLGVAVDEAIAAASQSVTRRGAR